jgi:TRAP-type C4-dicarboxylate transport system permease small subunit
MTALNLSKPTRAQQMSEGVLPSELEGPPAPAPPADALTRLIEILAAIGTIWTFGLMFLIVADVVGRSFLRLPLSGVAEIAGVSIVGIVFLQLASAINSGRMTRADFLLEMLGGRDARAVRFLEIVFAILGAVAMGIVAYAVWPNMLKAIERKEFIGVPGTFTFATWPFMALIVMGSALSVIIYLRLAWRHAATFSRERQTL